MKRLIILTAFITFCGHALAQDIITKKDATEIQAKVVKVGVSEIEYKQWNNQDGPIYTVPVEDVFTIKYENGQRDVMSQLISENSTKKQTNLNTKPHYEGDLGFGYAVKINDWSNGATFESTHGVRINPYIFAGAGFGFHLFYAVPYYSVDKKGYITKDTDINIYIPVFTEFKGYYPVSEKISLYGVLDLGASIEVYYGDPTRFYMTVGPGIQIGKTRAKFDFSTRYQHYGKRNGAMQFRIGLHF